MMLETKIKTLSSAIEKYTTTDISKEYTRKEVDFVYKHLEKHPTVRYSKDMMKRIIAEAKRKKLSKGRLALIEELRTLAREYEHKTYNKATRAATDHFVEQLPSLDIDFRKVKRVHLEHDSDPAGIYCHYYGADQNFKNDNELGRSETEFDFSPIWGKFYDNDKYDRLTELIEEVEFEEIDYDTAFEDLFKLQSYKLVKMAFNRKATLAKLNELFGDQKVEIILGEHDCEKYLMVKI